MVIPAEAGIRLYETVKDSYDIQKDAKGRVGTHSFAFLKLPTI
jgi:hypothetical protein